MVVGNIGRLEGHYYSDGTGRDSYIHGNNGNLYKGKVTAAAGPSGRDMGYTKVNRLIQESVINASVRYWPQGSGRDTYAFRDDHVGPRPFAGAVAGVVEKGMLRQYPQSAPSTARSTLPRPGGPMSAETMKQLESNRRLATSSHELGGKTRPYSPRRMKYIEKAATPLEAPHHNRVKSPIKRAGKGSEFANLQTSFVTTSHSASGKWLGNK